MRCLFSLFASLFVCVAAHGLFAQDAPVEFTSVGEVRADQAVAKSFTLQGEYLSSEDIEGHKLGLQVIADGNDKFRFTVYLGGLPGGDWKPEMSYGTGTITLKDDNTLEFVLRKFTSSIGDLPDGLLSKPLTAKFERGQGAGQGAGGRGQRRGENGGNAQPARPSSKIIVAGQDPAPEITFEKVVRRSPTLGAKAPEGATVIFDGTNVDKFEAGAKINELQPRGNNANNASPQRVLWSEAVVKPFEKDKPYTLHIEFINTFMPTKQGQARSNSGVYIAESYECQVLDSFGHVPPQNNECGGFYQIKAPIVNACYPPLTWQTYDIDYTPAKYADGKKTANARVTVKQNGVTIQDDVELPKETPGRKAEADEARGLYLQGHGNKVQYRNIWVKYN
ncbi:MAG: DUF1080 domain-containing protein [Planctomycetaceae bacterium]|jgi:hypothetical protein|nr:DUF1080 domain-containing protein [Planctomycetaceae bacterium]